MRVLLLVLQLFAGACGKPSVPRPLRAKVVISTEEGYKWKDVTFKYLQDPDKMHGAVGTIVGGVVFNITFDSDLVKEDPEPLYSQKGGDVKTDYLLEDGVMIPQNFDTLAMFSLYKAFETCVDFWHDNFGLSLEDQRPSRLIYDPKFFFQVEGTRVSAVKKRNASYLLYTGDFLINKTSQREEIPLKLNLSVLAHEIGHKIFDIQFAQRDFNFYKTKNKAAEKQLRGINEGWADFAAWLLTQRPREIEESLPDMGEERSLPVSWTSRQLLEGENSVCTGQHYCKGAILASSLYDLAQLGVWDRMSVGRHVFNAIAKFREDWDTHKGESGFDYDYLLVRIINEFEETDREQVCTVFQKWFDDPLNLKSLEAACPD